MTRALPGLVQAARLLAVPGTAQFLRSKGMIALGLLAAFAGTIACLVAREGSSRPGESFQGLEFFLLAPAVAPLVSLFFGTAAMASEREAGTLSFLFTRPIRRSAVVLGKGAAAVALAAIAVTLIHALVWAFSGDADAPSALFGGLGALLLETIALTSLFVLLGAVLVRSLYVGLAYVALYEGALGNALQASPYTVTFHARTLLRHWSGDLVPSLYSAMPAEPTSQAVLVLLGVAAGSLALAAAWVETREYGLRDRPKEE